MAKVAVDEGKRKMLGIEDKASGRCFPLDEVKSFIKNFTTELETFNKVGKTGPIIKTVGTMALGTMAMAVGMSVSSLPTGQFFSEVARTVGPPALVALLLTKQGPDAAMARAPRVQDPGAFR